MLWMHIETRQAHTTKCMNINQSFVDDGEAYKSNTSDHLADNYRDS
jgi:hypothetical protein